MAKNPKGKKSKKRLMKKPLKKTTITDAEGTERVITGIPGFDALVEGGFPRGKLILLSGTPGTCKTIFGLQFLYNGAKLYGEKGMMVTLEENVEGLKSQALRFGWDFDALEREGLIEFVRLVPGSIKMMSGQELSALAQRKKIKRLVLDSLSSVAINTPMLPIEAGSTIKDINVLRFVYTFISDLRILDGSFTTLLLSQTQGEELSRDSVSEFVCDGLVYIKYASLGGDYSRGLVIRKMRETAHNEDIHPLEIGEKGIKIHKM
ncbi:MAG: hypothetical protein KJ955_02845 [Nanoarchaeota archaeon]|nr:hypothetical protein [Nanoarchaeota archaeon]